MKKKLIIITVVGLVVAVGVVVGLSKQKATVGNGTLSERSKEYLKNRPSNKNTSLQYAALNEDGKEIDTANQTFTVGTCFSLRVPLRVSSHREEENCFVSIALRSPRGNIVAYKKNEVVQSFDDVSGVPMRRVYTDLYTEKMVTVNDRDFVIFSKKDEYFERSAFVIVPDGYIVINAMIYGGENLDATFQQVLESLDVF